MIDAGMKRPVLAGHVTIEMRLPMPSITISTTHHHQQRLREEKPLRICCLCYEQLLVLGLSIRIILPELLSIVCLPPVNSSNVYLAMMATQISPVPSQPSSRQVSKPSFLSLFILQLSYITPLSESLR